jgi:hypothetical protein
MKFVIASLAVGLAVYMLMLGAAKADPLANAHAGMMQCYQPDTSRKVCLALASYVFERNGAIINRADVLLSPQPALIMRTSSQVIIKGDAVCGPMRREDLDAAQFFANGTPIPADKVAEIRNEVAHGYEGLLGKEVCTTYIPAGDRLSAQVTIDGAPNAQYTQQVIWVKPDDGYTVAP